MKLWLGDLHGTRSERIVGATEVVFQVDDVQAAFDALRKRGVAFDSAPHNATGSEWAANFRDPDGHRLSIFGPIGT